MTRACIECNSRRKKKVPSSKMITRLTSYLHLLPPEIWFNVQRRFTFKDCTFFCFVSKFYLVSDHWCKEYTGRLFVYYDLFSFSIKIFFEYAISIIFIPLPDLRQYFFSMKNWSFYVTINCKYSSNYISLLVY